MKLKRDLRDPTKEEIKAFKVGDKVYSRYSEKESGIPRTITAVIESDQYGSGRGIMADAGEICPCCGYHARPAVGYRGGYIDGCFFVPVHAIEVEELNAFADEVEAK